MALFYQVRRYLRWSAPVVPTWNLVPPTCPRHPPKTEILKNIRCDRRTDRRTRYPSKDPAYYVARVKTVSHKSAQDKCKHRKREHVFELQQLPKTSSISLHVLSQPLSKTGVALFCGKFFRVFSSAAFNSETVFGFG